MNSKKLFTLCLPAVVVIIIDQVTKYMIRTTPALQHWEIIPGWLAFHYTQNPGMALGMSWASTPIISGIAIIATIAILIYILRTMDRAHTGYLICMGLVLGGAIGNIIDRLVMGIIESYGGLLEGHVVDFIHFTLTINGYPVFPYIFNVADMAISIAIMLLLIFNKQILPQPENTAEQPESTIDSDIDGKIRPEEIKAEEVRPSDMGPGDHIERG